jgi:processive 1,2-diacylglycerol beta-glucosyltransferase
MMLFRIRPGGGQKRGPILWRHPPLGRRELRVLILTAEVGEGHVAAARALAEELIAERAGVEVIVCDALIGLGAILRAVLRDAYRLQLRRAAWIFGFGYWLFARYSLFRGLGGAGLVLFGARSLQKLVATQRPDMVVSTYPAATHVLGHLRRRGRLNVTACATITDLAGVEFWAHPGIDLHLVMHESCIELVERIAGPGSARCVRPLVSRSFFSVRPRSAARRALDLPQDGAVVVVSGGGWGVGDLEGAVRSALTVPVAKVLCLAGRDEERRRRLAAVFAEEPRVSVLGFTDRMSDLLAAADVLVHSTGGVTCLEAFVCGCPVVAYGAPPGHAGRVGWVMGSLGLAQAPRSPEELVEAIARTLGQPRPARRSPDCGPSTASLVVRMSPRVRPLPRSGFPRVRPGVALAATLLARDIATVPVVGGARVGPAKTSALPALRPGEVVVLTLRATPATARKLGSRIIGAIARQR